VVLTGHTLSRVARAVWRGGFVAAVGLLLLVGVSQWRAVMWVDQRSAPRVVLAEGRLVVLWRAENLVRYSGVGIPPVPGLSVTPLDELNGQLVRLTADNGAYGPTLRLPLVTLLVVLGVVLLATWRVPDDLKRVYHSRGGPPRCGECGYLLVGNTSGRCPECGTPCAVVRRRGTGEAG